MGFELFVQCFENGEFAGILREDLFEKFGPEASKREPDLWRLHYADTDWCDVYVRELEGDSSLVMSITVDRPCGDIRMWDALYEVMKLGHVVLYFPGSTETLVAAEATIPHLPADIIEALGPSRCVVSGHDLLASIK